MGDGLPHFVSGRVVKGFGRGSKDLGIPTANLDREAVDGLPACICEGVYLGWARVGPSGPVSKMVMSLGTNPFYGNETRSLEVHLIGNPGRSFYGETIRLCVLKFLRTQAAFGSTEELVRAIRSDIADAERLLETPELVAYRDHQYFCES